MDGCGVSQENDDDSELEQTAYLGAGLGLRANIAGGAGLIPLLIQ